MKKREEEIKERKRQGEKKKGGGRYSTLHFSAPYNTFLILESCLLADSHLDLAVRVRHPGGILFQFVFRDEKIRANR